MMGNFFRRGGCLLLDFEAVSVVQHQYFSRDNGGVLWDLFVEATVAADVVSSLNTLLSCGRCLTFDELRVKTLSLFQPRCPVGAVVIPVKVTWGLLRDGSEYACGSLPGDSFERGLWSGGGEMWAFSADRVGDEDHIDWVEEQMCKVDRPVLTAVEVAEKFARGVGEEKTEGDYVATLVQP